MRSAQRILLLVILATPLINLGVDIYTPSLPTVANHFGASHFMAKISLIIYSIAFGIVQPFMGPVTDYLGRRHFILVSLLITVLSNVAALYSGSIEFLCAMRVLQGIGGSMISVALKGMMVDAFEGHALAKAMSYYSLGWSLTPIFAPLIGAYLEHYIAWDACFALIAIYAVLGFFATLFFISETAQKLSKPLTEWIVLYKKIALNPMFLSAVWVLAVQFAILLIFYLDSPFLLQDVLGISVQHYGQLLFALGCMYLLGNVVNRILLQTYPAIKISYWGLLITLVMAVLMLIFGLLFPLNLWLLLVPVAIIFIVDGMVFPNVMALCMMYFKSYGGTAGGILGGALSICAALISTLDGILRANTMIPLALAYTILVAIAWWVFLRFFRHQVKADL